MQSHLRVHVLIKRVGVDSVTLGSIYSVWAWKFIGSSVDNIGCCSATNDGSGSYIQCKLCIMNIQRTYVQTISTRAQEGIECWKIYNGQRDEGDTNERRLPLTKICRRIHMYVYVYSLAYMETNARVNSLRYMYMHTTYCYSCRKTSESAVMRNSTVLFMYNIYKRTCTCTVYEGINAQTYTCM